MKTFITVRNKKTGIKLFNRMLWVMKGDSEDLDNLIKELKEIKSFVNGEANKAGLRGSDIQTEVEFKSLNQVF